MGSWDRRAAIKRRKICDADLTRKVRITESMINEMSSLHLDDVEEDMDVDLESLSLSDDAMDIDDNDSTPIIKLSDVAQELIHRRKEAVLKEMLTETKSKGKACNALVLYNPNTILSSLSKEENESDSEE
ncbi:hypothetical protein ACOME3_003587 [Neoechinorhynchus agilis]